MDQKGIDRINELARKAKTQELTPEEKKEQHKLRNREGRSNDYAKLNRKPKLRILQAEVVLDKVQPITNSQSKRRRIIT